MREISETKIEAYLKKLVENEGGLIRKCRWLDRSGAPDRFVALYGCVFLVELKGTGKEPKPHQFREHNALKAHGVNIFVANSFGQVEDFIIFARDTARKKKLGWK